MASVAPQVMNAKAFKDATNPRNVFKRNRGRLLARVDKAVEKWKDGLGPPQVRIANLSRILKACRAWLESRSDKDTPTSSFRRAGVQMLADQAYARLQYELFEKRKATNLYTGSMQPLQGGYRHERTTYLASGKTQALSGSTAAALVRNAPAIEGLNLNGKTFNQLTLQEFENLVRTHAPEMAFETEVIFLKKQDRIGTLVVVEDGVLYDGPDSKLDTGSLDQGGFPYVIDAYGNLFTTNHHVMTNNLPASQRFNHSSFNAGKDVVCAGIIQCVNGSLWQIDNNSGHYKPDRIQLINALRILEHSGVDMSKLRVGLKEPSGRPGQLAFKYYNNATAFLANPRMPPHEEFLE